MSYRKVSDGFIKGDVGRALRGDPDGFSLATYLMITEHNKKGLGLFWLPAGYAATDLGMGIDKVSEAFRKLSDLGFCRYDDEQEVVFVCEGARHEWGEAPGPDGGDPGSKSKLSKMHAGLRKTLFEQLDSCRKSYLVKDFFERYSVGWARILRTLRKGSDRVSILYRETTEDLSKGSGSGDGSGSGKGSGDSKSDAPARKEARDVQGEAKGFVEGAERAPPGDRETQGDSDPEASEEPGLRGRRDHSEGQEAPGPGQPPAEAEPDQPGVEAAEPNGLDLGDLADRLIQIAGSSVQVSHRDGDILIRRVELRRQPPEELILAARILAGQFRGGAPNKLEYVSQPIAYLDEGPWDRMAGFVTFRRCWREGFAEFWGDEPLAATAWFDTFEDRQAASEAAGGDRVLGQLAVHKGSKQWRDGKVPSPERWLRGHRFNDTPRPASSGRKRPGAQPEDVEAERDRRFNIVR